MERTKFEICKGCKGNPPRRAPCQVCDGNGWTTTITPQSRPLMSGQTDTKNSPDGRTLSISPQASSHQNREEVVPFFSHGNSPKVNRVPKPKVKEGHLTAQNNDNGIADKDAAEGKL